MEQWAWEIRVCQYWAAIADRPDLPVASRVAIEAAASLEGEEQRRALHSLVYGKGRISALGGLAGTGKSVVAGRATTIWQGSGNRSEEHTSELQSLMRISYAVFCLKKKKNKHKSYTIQNEKQNKLQPRH